MEKPIIQRSEQEEDAIGSFHYNKSKIDTK
jgi:hypothetical protein